jgi:hypothetical protein
MKTYMIKKIMEYAKANGIETLSECIHALIDAQLQKSSDRFLAINELATKTADKLKELEEGVCEWSPDSEDESGDTWRTGCGRLFTLNDGGPRENKMKFCFHCGKRIVEKFEFRIPHNQDSE